MSIEPKVDAEDPARTPTYTPPTNYEEALSQFVRNKAEAEERNRKEWRSAWKTLYIGVPTFLLLVWLASKL